MPDVAMPEAGWAARLRSSSTRLASHHRVVPLGPVGVQLAADSNEVSLHVSGQQLTVRSAGKWVDAEVVLGSVWIAGRWVKLHRWNHAPRELPQASFELLVGWWMQALRIRHSCMIDALSGRRLDVLQQCVSISVVANAA
eukprot:7201859-Prymnesium_polylepis.1